MSTKPKTDPERWVMLIFTILEDGNLQGIWTHSDKIGDGDPNGRNRQLFMEIARKIDEGGQKATSQHRGFLEGEYHVAWIDEPNDNAIRQKIRIVRNGTEYALCWSAGNSPSYYGIGLRLGHDKLAVTFWPGANPTRTFTAQI